MYSRCVRECETETVVEKCNCRDAYMPGYAEGTVKPVFYEILKMLVLHLNMSVGKKVSVLLLSLSDLLNIVILIMYCVQVIVLGVFFQTILRSAT